MWFFCFRRTTNASPPRDDSRPSVRTSSNCRSQTERIGRATITSRNWSISAGTSGTSGTSLAMPSSESLIATAIPLRTFIPTSALAPISLPE